MKDIAAVRIDDISLIGTMRIQEAFLGSTEIVLLGNPHGDGDAHNCDLMGCGTASHVIFRVDLNHEQIREIVQWIVGGRT